MAISIQAAMWLVAGFSLVALLARFRSRRSTLEQIACRGPRISSSVPRRVD